MRFPAHIKYIVISILFVVASINFTKTTLEILKSSKRLDEVRDEVGSMESEKTELEKSIEYKQTDDYLEERARDDLNLVKPGEKLYVVENLDPKVREDTDVLSEYTERVKSTVESKRPNALLWYKLIFD